MSRVGKSKIKMPDTVEIKQLDGQVEIKNKANKALGFVYNMPKGFNIVVENGMLSVAPEDPENVNIPLWGTTVRNIFHKVKGLDKPFETNVDLVGVGYKAAVNGKTITFNLGYSHEIIHELHPAVDVKIEKNTRLSFSSYDKERLGAEVSRCVKYRPPEPYKGKGVIKEGLFILRKEGKKK